MKIRLIRAARIRHEAGEIVEVSPAEAGFLLSTGSAAPVEAAQTRETPEDATARETPENAAPEIETPEKSAPARETPEIMKARKVVPTRKTRK